MRGLMYGSIGAAFAIALPTASGPLVGLLSFAFAWMFVLLFAGLPLLLAAAVLRPLQEKLRRWIPGRLFAPVALLAAVPFGILIASGLMALLGGKDFLRADPQGFSGLRVAVAGGLGLGLGSLRDLPAET